MLSHIMGSDPPPVRRTPKSEAAALTAFLSTEPAPGSHDHDAWVEQAYTLAEVAWDYARSESCVRTLLENQQRVGHVHESLSFALGNQGRY
jgi:hypothetical protein